MTVNGYTYDNQIQPSAGIKVNKLFRFGIISAGTAYAYQDRFSAATASGRTDFISDWFGWQSIANPKNRFPGSSWASIGHTAPVEHGNLIEQGYATQGYVSTVSAVEPLSPTARLRLGTIAKGMTGKTDTSLEGSKSQRS